MLNLYQEEAYFMAEFGEKIKKLREENGMTYQAYIWDRKKRMENESHTSDSPRF
jgi:hypothetical protein